MAIIRVEKRSNFTVVDNTFIRDNNLSLKAKGLMLLMLSLPPEWDYSIAGLSAICQEGKTAIRNCLKELEENYYLIRERRNNEKGYFVYEYILKEIPEVPHIGNQHTDEVRAAEAHTEEAHIVEEHTENRTQLKKEELKKDLLNKDLPSKERVRGLSEIEASALLDEIIEDSELKELYLEYIQVREDIGAPLTARSLKLLIARCERLSDFNIHLQKTMLETACIQQWKSVYPPAKDEKARNSTIDNFGKILFGNN
jgi:predicted transcriptional regulator